MSSPKKNSRRPRIRFKSPLDPSYQGLVAVEDARKLTPEQAALPRAHGRHIPPERVEGEEAQPARRAR